MPIKLSEISGLMVEKKKEISKHFTIETDSLLTGYNEAIDQQSSRQIGLNMEKLEIIAVRAMNKESIRNGNTGIKHEFSEFCSCGVCHTATIIADEIISTEHELIEVVKESPSN